MTKHFGTGQEPVSPSELKISDRQITQAQVSTAQPTDRDEGVDVSEWRRVVLSVHPVDPDINDAGAVGFQLQIKVWRWKLKNRWGTGQPGGQWYAEQVVTVSMDGDVANGGPMEYEFPTWDAEKMHFQPVVALEAPATWTAAITVAGLVPRVTEDGDSCECEAGGAGGAGGGGGSLVIASMFDLIAHDDYTYSTLRGDFGVARQSATTFTLDDLDFAVDERQILAVGLKRSGAVTPTRIWYRDKDLLCDWTPATNLVTISGFNINVLDEIMVWVEGPSKTNDPTNRAKRVKGINPDAYHVVTDGEFLTKTLAESAPDELFPFMMGQDGYHWLSSAFTITGDLYVRLEATNDLERDGAEVWYDVTEEVLGVAQVDTTNDARAYPPQCWTGWKRMRWVVGESEAGGTLRLFMFRSAYGDNWNPVARDGEPALHAGPQMMGEAVSVQPAAETATYAARLITDLYHGLITAAYIYATQADRTEEDDPIDTRDVGDILADDLDLPQATTHNYYLSGEHYAGGSFHFLPDPDGAPPAPDGNTQLRIYAADRDDGTAPNALEYVDKTLAWFGAAVITTEQLLRFPTDVFIYYWHFEVLRPGAVGTEDYTLIARRAY